MRGAGVNRSGHDASRRSPCTPLRPPHKASMAGVSMPWGRNDSVRGDSGRQTTTLVVSVANTQNGLLPGSVSARKEKTTPLWWRISLFCGSRLGRSCSRVHSVRPAPRISAATIVIESREKARRGAPAGLCPVAAEHQRGAGALNRESTTCRRAVNACLGYGISVY
jgi:hypothetical protein